MSCKWTVFNAENRVYRLLQTSARESLYRLDDRRIIVSSVAAADGG
jgi:hypothetical protein